MSMINIEVTKNPNENGMSTIRRFTRRVQEAGIIPLVKGRRYAERDISKVAQKAYALKRMEKRKVNEKLRKLGKIA